MNHIYYQHNGQKPSATNENMSAQELSYYETMLQNVVGGTIGHAVIVTDDEDISYETRPVIVLVIIKNGRAYHCEILSDEEGNDAGVLAVSEVKTK